MSWIKLRIALRNLRNRSELRPRVRCADPMHNHTVLYAQAFEGGGKFYCTRSGYPGDPNDVRGPW